MANKKIGMGMLVMVFSIFGLIVTGCASIQPMSNEAIRKYALASNHGNFRNFQYYVSRDIVLKFVSSSFNIDRPVGQINVNRDAIQFLSSSPGIVIDVKQNENGHIMLGVAFEENDDDLLWFVQNPAKAGTYFYLVYTNEATREINYGGNLYTVTYEQAAGAGAVISRLNPFSKVKKGEYDNIEPFLLYEERVRETEQRRNVRGRRL